MPEKTKLAMKNKSVAARGKGLEESMREVSEVKELSCILTVVLVKCISI